MMTKAGPSRIVDSKPAASMDSAVVAMQQLFSQFLELFEEKGSDPTIDDFRGFSEKKLWPMVQPLLQEGKPVWEVLNGLAAMLNVGAVKQDALGLGAPRFAPDETKPKPVLRAAEAMFAHLYRLATSRA